MMPDYSFLKIMRDVMTANQPELFRLLSPRRYVPPTGYTNPVLTTSILVAHSTFLTMPRGEITKSMVDCSLIAWKLVEEGMPTYFVGRDFVEALTCTEPPADMLLNEIEWPFEAIQFFLPESWAMEYFGRAVPFVSVARQPTGNIEPPRCVAQLLPHCRSCGIELPPDSYDGDKTAFLAEAPVLFGDKPVDYAASWSMNQTVKSLLHESVFKDYTDLDGNPIIKDGSPEEDLSLIHKIDALAVWLLLSMQCSPEHIEAPQLVRPAKVKRGMLVKDELWAPRWLGRRYTWEREPLGGTHASPRLHRKRGHMKHVVHGPQRTLRTLKWIKPYWVGAKIAA